MANLDLLQRNLEENGFTVSRFATGQAASDYLDAALDGKTIGVGGSMTLMDLGLPQRLGTHNTVISHALGGTQQDAAAAEIYLSSVNGAAETGELINIDGTGNRVASGLFGHEKVYFVVGANKVAPDFDAALWRARNIAGPKNAQRLNKKTPCAAKGDKCYNCKSDERICRTLVVYWKKPTSMDMEVVLVDETLGF